MKRGIVISSIKGLAVAAAFTVVILTVFAFIAYRADDPDSMLGALSIASLALTSALCGFAAVKFNRSAGLACGALSGAMLAVSVFVLSLIVNGGAGNVFFRILICGAIVLISSVAGLLGLPKSESTVKQAKKYREMIKTASKS